MHRQKMSLFDFWRATSIFGFGSLSFCFNPSSLGRTGWFHCPPRFWCGGNRLKQCMQLLKTICDVLRLVSKTLAAEDELSFAGHSASIGRNESVFNVTGKRFRFGKAPSHNHFGINLVDVLSARP